METRSSNIPLESDKYMQGITSLQTKLDQVLQLLKATNRINGDNILDNQDVCMLFNLTPRTLQRYRSIGELPYFRIGGKPLYLESEVYCFLKTMKQNKLPKDEEPK